MSTNIREPWEGVSDIRGALSYALGRVSRATQQITAINAERDSYIAAAQTAATARSARYTRTLEFYGRTVDVLAAKALSEVSNIDPDRFEGLAPEDLKVWQSKGTVKSVPLPTGKVSGRLVDGGFHIEDTSAFARWLAARDGMVWPAWLKSVTIDRSEIDWSTYGKTDDGTVLTEDGEIVPGVEWRPARISITAKPDLGVEQPEWLPSPAGLAEPDDVDVA